MAREKQSFRDNLERICEVYPDKELLTMQEVREFLGISYHMTRNLIQFNKMKLVSKADLARQISL